MNRKALQTKRIATENNRGEGCRQSLALIIMDGDLIGADVSVEKSLKQRKNTGRITRINTFYFQKKYEQGMNYWMVCTYTLLALTWYLSVYIIKTI